MTLGLPFAGRLLAAGAHEGVLLKVLIQLCVIIAAARIFAMVFRRLGQPVVVGEILAGIILGPSLFGHFFPELSAKVFDASVADVFGVLAQFGLIFLLFMIGLEFDFSHLKAKGKASIAISLTGIVLPFTLGLLLGVWMLPLLDFEVNKWAFALFIGTAMSITAIPILGRIMMELNITRSKLGAVTITSAAIDDAMGWILLATVTAIVQTGFNFLATVQMLAMSIGFFIVMSLGVKPRLASWLRKAMAKDGGDLGFNAMAVIFIVLFLCSIATSLIGIFAIFGAFILGAVLSSEEEFRKAITGRLSGFITVLFLPIFFTYTGLRTNVGTLESAHLWLMALAVIAVAVFGKFAGCTLAARWGGFSWREAGVIGVMMNTRALMELIVINVGKNLGVIPDSVFCMLVMMAILTTVMTTPILLRLQKGTEIEPMIADSDFAKAAKARKPGPVEAPA